MRKIFLDVDTGSDDAVAILLAELHPEIEVVGIGTTYNLHGIVNTTENTLRVLRLLGKDTPVYMGSPVPIVKDLSAREQNSKQEKTGGTTKDGKKVMIHTAYLDLPPSERSCEKTHAISRYIEYLRNTDEKITFVMTGGMTNLALALRIAPDIAEKIEEVVMMGGGIAMSNRTLAAESNFFRDPEAARILVNSGIKTTIFPLDGTHTAMFDLEDAAAFRRLNSPVGDLTAQMIEERAYAYEATGQTPRPESPIHDAMTVAYLIDPSIADDMQRVSCDVDMGGGIADGMLIMDHRYSAVAEKDTSIVFHICKERFIHLILETFARFDK